MLSFLLKKETSKNVADTTFKHKTRNNLESKHSLLMKFDQFMLAYKKSYQKEKIYQQNSKKTAT